MGDWFVRAFGGAVADVRQKLVEEAWFGRAELPDPTPFPGVTLEERMFPSPQHQRALHDWLRPEAITDPGKEQPDAKLPEHDIDR